MQTTGMSEVTDIFIVNGFKNFHDLEQSEPSNAYQRAKNMERFLIAQFAVQNSG